MRVANQLAIFSVLIPCAVAGSLLRISTALAEDYSLSKFLVQDESCNQKSEATEFFSSGESSVDISEQCGECGPCPPIYVLSINGVNATVDSPFHDWVRRNTPGGIYHANDPYNGSNEWCNGDPSAAADRLRTEIEQFKQDHPCAKVIVVGHSLGGVAAWFLRGVSDCSVYIDPPTDCYLGGPIFCASQTDICDAVDGGIKRAPGYIPTKQHTPFDNPALYCDDLKKIREKIDACVQSVRPNCNDNNPLDPAPNCNPTPTPTPQPTPTPNPNSGNDGCLVEDNDVLTFRLQTGVSANCRKAATVVKAN